MNIVWQRERVEKLNFLYLRRIQRDSGNAARLFNDADAPMLRLDTHGRLLAWNKVPHMPPPPLWCVAQRVGRRVVAAPGQVQAARPCQPLVHRQHLLVVS